MGINRIDHISIAVNNLEQAKPVWQKVLGKNAPDEEYTDDVECIRVARYMVGEVGFELMESTSEDGEVARFIRKRGEGVMLVSLNTDDVRKDRETLEKNNYPFAGEILPFRDGQYTFIKPSKMNGVLLELIDGQQKK